MNYLDVLHSSLRKVYPASSNPDSPFLSEISTIYEYSEEPGFLHLFCSGSPTITMPAKYQAVPAGAAVVITVAKGEAQIDPGSRDFRIRAGEFAVVPAMEGFSILFTMLPCTMTYEVFGGSGLSLFPFRPGTPFHGIPESPFSRHSVDLLRGIPASPDPDDLLRMHSALTELVSEFLLSDRSKKAPASPAGAPSPLPRYLDYLYTVIHSQYQKPFSLLFYERQLDISRYRLCREYSKTFGISPLKDLNQTRIRKAKELLLCTDDQIQEIAFLVGYENPGHFIRLFHSAEGITPGEYRKMYTKA